MPYRPAARALVGTALLTALTGLLTGVAACSTSAPARLDEATAPASSASAAADLSSQAPLDLPDTAHSTVGALAEDFPPDLVDLPDDADILVSTAQPVAGGDLVEISLNLRTTLTADELMDQLRGGLEDAGFTETPVATPPAGVAAESTFARHTGEVLTVAVLDRDGVRTLTLGGRVAVA
ncbi:hypothetical protein KIN34_11365 [Cellulomonas sp. DKR-3]|uniref:Secreted protein n=1 Tax=Cellulomonas fulva TaxID=2835530 RepID=A0ABS5U0J6_9CELL|nr:hypothetical protein [Cellulomonas fulva]MBT0994880.1 hypothetical protein [Cellulomonas fulva]